MKYCGCEHTAASGSVRLKLDKQTRNRGAARPYSLAEIDVVLVYVPQVDTVLWIPPEEFDGRRNLSFRYLATRNGQQKGVKITTDYEWQSTDRTEPVSAITPTTPPTVENARTA